jgi:hypothetical protein
MWRVHQAAYAPDGFNPDPVSAGRFRPFPSSRKVVPTMYIADSFDAAISESVFHDLDPHASDQIVPRARLYGQVRSIITPSRDLRLADLRGAGLRRIRLKTTDLIETDPDSYPDTARWGRAIYGCPLKPGGIAWSSRMHPAGTAAILFGTRAKGLAFDYDDIKPLWQGEAFDEFLAAAERAKVTVLL